MSNIETAEKESMKWNVVSLRKSGRLQNTKRKKSKLIKLRKKEKITTDAEEI